MRTSGGMSNFPNGSPGTFVFHLTDESDFSNLQGKRRLVREIEGGIRL